jgi:hypothetical protein
MQLKYANIQVKEKKEEEEPYSLVKELHISFFLISPTRNPAH